MTISHLITDGSFDKLICNATLSLSSEYPSIDEISSDSLTLYHIFVNNATVSPFLPAPSQGLQIRPLSFLSPSVALRHMKASFRAHSARFRLIRAICPRLLLQKGQITPMRDLSFLFYGYQLFSVFALPFTVSLSTKPSSR